MSHNQHFYHPPSQFFLYSPSPYAYYGAQFGPYPSPTAASPNGLPSPHPYPHPPPGFIPQGPPVDPYPTPDVNGWHDLDDPSQHMPPNSPQTPQHPPGLTIPSHIPPVFANEPQEPDHPQIHEFWRGRLAPLPGYRSRPILLPRKETAQVEKPQEKTQKMKTKKAEDFRFDTYAECFVPQYLANIQKQIHPLKPLPAVPPFPTVKYLESFLIPRMIEESMKYNELSLLQAPPLPKQEKIPPLAIDTYHAHWTEILRWELDAIVSAKEEIVVWRITAKVVSWKDAEFVFSVPGVRENHPYLEIGDLVHLREVSDAEKRGTNRAIEGRVAALRKREGLVHITSPPLKEHIQTYVPLTLQTTKTENGFIVLDAGEPIPFVFNVSFMTNARPLCSMDRAVSSIPGIMNSSTPGINLSRQWLFPELKHYTDAPAAVLRNGEIRDEEWADPGLNTEQKLAVSTVALHQSPIPHLISGPPGTGKTRTVVETVLQIFRIQPEACILLCAPSNPATDTLALRLQKHLLQHEMLRLNDPNRTFAEVPDIIKPYCYVENDKFSIPPWKKLMQYRVVVCSCLDANILVRAQCTNAKLMTLEDEITSSIHPNRRHKHVVQPHWTHLLIDEAAQGSEPELLIPISAVLPEVYDTGAAGRTFMPQLALCGDINQLGPHVASDQARTAEFEVSLLERLFERPLYAQGSSSALVLNGQGRRTLPYTTLVKNYRSHPAILMPPSAIFYNDTLQPCAVNGKISWTGLSNPNFPLKFIGTKSEEKSTDERASWFNAGQITIVVNTIKSLLDNPRASDPPLRPEHIGVMAPWRKQVWTMRKRLRNEGLSAVDVGTVEDYQGRENRVVIISCVRSTARFLEDDHKKGMGLIFERKRMNVAITRAKELLVVVGNGSLLQRDPYWKSFLQFTLRNGLYEGPDLSLEMDGNYISRLESELAQSEMEVSKLSPEEQGLLLAGDVAREVLKE